MSKINKAKQEGRLEDIKSDFITVASHQLRTPISAIRWSLDTLMSGRVGALSDKQKQVVSEAYQNNKFMVKVVNDLLRVSRLEEKGISLSPQFVNLVSSTKDFIKRYRSLANAFNCTISLDVAKKLPKAYIDPLQIKPIIEALIDNAVRYSQAKGSIEISIKKAKGYLVFKIKDNGIGIPAKEQPLVFSKFFRGSNAMKAQTDGLGLDLYLAKKMIEASGGKIDFTSQENKGTTFKVYLPISKDQIKNLPVQTSPSRRTKNDAKNLTGPEDVLKKEREFVSITVHELKAPLGITKWSLEMLESQKPGKLNAQQLDLIGQVYRGNERLLVLVRDLLNLAKLQEGKFEIEPKLIQFENVIADVIKSFKVQAEKKNIKLEWLEPKPKFPKVKADSNRVAQVITNLVSNAVKYTPANGRVTVKLGKKTGSQLKSLSNKSASISIGFTNSQPGYLVLSIQDTGVGILDEDKKKLFTKFFRSKEVLKSEAEGTGLGLYITKSIVNLHQGDIWFTSQVGKGSTFYFSLPIT